MGEYVYALRSPRLCRTVEVRVTDQALNPTGEIRTVFAASFSYLYKPHFGLISRHMDDWTNRFFARMEKLWIGFNLPQYLVVTTERNQHRIHVGEIVYYFPQLNAMQTEVLPEPRTVPQSFSSSYWPKRLGEVSAILKLNSAKEELHG